VTRRAKANLVVVLILGALAVPAIAVANSGGAGFGPGAGSGSSGRSAAGGTVQPGNVTQTVSGNGITLSARISVLLRHQIHFFGSASRSAAGKTAVIERLDKQAGWSRAASAVIAPSGSYTAVWKTNHTGRMAMRVIVTSGPLSSYAAASSPSLTLTVYRPAIATTYGEGSWGSQTACGETLTHHTLGVANRTLPCGTKVAIYWNGKTMTVPVIDRGPYANHADWDLTLATAAKLGIPGTETIGAVSLPSH
jgi:rare lipoprotein A